ncbi:hypothetical protein GCM10009795_012470 [Nocardioides hankookensis]|uniref:Type IV toxin-antitoxin system AbiEi family antitoxin domain-containing protein n=1 Tax=Nocardioides hankookensis TaxID=443157 RepID=A0ABW1LIZ7_9ACTN
METPVLPDHPFGMVDARHFGLDASTLFQLVRRGVLRHPVPGVYIPASLPDGLELRCRALRLILPPDAFVCDRSAAWLHAGDRALAPNEHLEVPPLSCFVPSEGHRLRNKLVVSGEREILPRDLMEVDGLCVTTPLRTALDLGRLESNADLKLNGMDAMLRLGQFSHEQLLAQVPRFNRRRGVVALRVLAPLADGGSESFGESALRLRWIGAGLPRPTTQISVRDDGREIYRIDMGLEDFRFGAEYDGEQWHGPERAAYDGERHRWLEDERNWTLEHFRRRHVFGQQQDAEVRLRTSYEALRARLGLPRRFFV